MDPLHAFAGDELASDMLLNSELGDFAKGHDRLQQCSTLGEVLQDSEVPINIRLPRENDSLKQSYPVLSLQAIKPLLSKLASTAPYLHLPSNQ